MTDQLLDNSAAARTLSISTRHLAKLRDAGVIPIVRISQSRRGIRYSSRALEDFILSQTQQANDHSHSHSTAGVQR